MPGIVTPPVGAAPLPGPMQPTSPDDMSPTQLADRIDGIDRIALAVGGLMATPYDPETAGQLGREARELRDMMAVFVDRIPTFVAVLQGEAAPMVCADGRGDAETRELHGYTVAINDQVAFLVRGDSCTITMRGAYSQLLEERGLCCRCHG